jgi:electron transfer flavoprotein beta subunit
MGADRGILVQTDQELQPLAVAKLLKKIVEEETPDLILMGKQAIDDDCNQTGQMLAALLHWPQATFASKIVIQQEEVVVTREIDGGLETVAIRLPGVITTDLRLNQPRYISLPKIMQAKNKPLQIVTAESLGVDITPHVLTVKVEAPPPRKAGVKVSSVAELVAKLEEAGVL